MDFDLSAEQRLMLDSVDTFMARHLPPEEVRARDVAADPPDHLLPLMGEAGFLGLPVPESDGGSGGDWRTTALVQERLGYHATIAAILFNRVTCFGIMTLLKAGTAEQKAAFLDALIAGQASFALALTEPGAGSDAGGITCRARCTKTASV